MTSPKADAALTSRRPRPGPQPDRYYPGINGLRTIAVALTILFHANVSWARGGFLGVDVFFAISGFVITLTLLREHERTNDISLRAFYMRRLWRLMPALVLMVIVAASLELGTRVIAAGVFAKEAAFALTYTYNIWQVSTGATGTALNHTWSLGVEEQFYLVWAPLLAGLLGVVAATRRRIGIVIGLIVALALSGIATSLILSTRAAFFLPWCRTDELLVGAALALALHHHRPARLLAVLGNPVVPLVALAALLALVPLVHDLLSWELAAGGFLGVALLSSVLVGHVYIRTGTGGSPLEALLASTPMTWLGDRSYGIYLYHYPIMFALRHHNVGTVPKVLIAGGGAVVIAALSYRFVEAPLRARGHRKPARTESAVAH